MKFVTGTMKWDSDSWLPSINALMPLIYVLSNRSLSITDTRLARKWLILSCLHALFSGSVYTELDRIIRALSKDRSIRKLYSITKRSLGRIEQKHFLTGRRSGPAMSLFITLLRSNNAKDWLTHDPLDGTVIGHNAGLQIHHFYPRECLSKHGIDNLDQINTFSNYTVISKETNLKFLDSEPIEYIARNNVRKKDLESQFIPLDEKLWRVRNYKKFLKARRELLVNAANRFLG
ncbi:MAG: hypothetical protein HY806_04710 [Nitrospirae bacterium]|nr:hypothetical protein [Nitrospirota bacterium]